MFDNFPEKYPRLFKIYDELDQFFTKLSDHHTFLIAAGIAFNIFLYLIPLFLMAIFVVNMVFDFQLLAGNLKDLLMEIFPPTDSAHKLINTIIDEVYYISDHSSTAGWIAIGILLWLSSTLFSSLRSGLNTIFEVHTKKIFIVYRLKDILIALVLAFFLLLSSYASPISSLIVSILERTLPEIISPYISRLALAGYSLFASFLFFYLLFRFVPSKRVSRYPRLIGTVLSVVLIEASRNFFAWYLTSLSNYGRFYGAYAVIVSMAVWIYYFTLIILLSAELGQYIYEKKIARDERRKKKEEETASENDEPEPEEDTSESQ